MSYTSPVRKGRGLSKFRSMVGDLPASAEHHHSEADRLYQHSLEVGLHREQPRNQRPSLCIQLKPVENSFRQFGHC